MTRSHISNEPTKSQVFYVGAILDKESMGILRRNLDSVIKKYKKEHPDSVEIKDWAKSQPGNGHGLEQLNHHCTANLKVLPEFESLLGKSVLLTVDGFGVDLKENVAAWRVSSMNPQFSVKANIPHITALCGPTGKVFKAGIIPPDRFIDISVINLDGIFLSVTPETIEEYGLKDGSADTSQLTKIARRISSFRSTY